MFARIYLILALLMGAFLITFGFACDPENPGDDDDDVSDDDTSDDDDDDTTAAYASVVMNAPDDFVGDFSLINDEYVGGCDDESVCTIKTTHLGPHLACFEAEGALFLCLEINISELAFQQEVLTWSGVDCDWGVAPEGTFVAYLDEDCTEIKDGVDPYEIETDIGYWENDDADRVLMQGLMTTRIVCGDQFKNASGSSHGWVSDNLDQIYMTANGDDYWYCLD